MCFGDFVFGHLGFIMNHIIFGFIRELPLKLKFLDETLLFSDLFATG